MKFLKENKLAVLSIGVVVLIAVLLAIPGQFAHYALKDSNSYIHNLSGYQFFFNSYRNNLDKAIGNSVVGSGIALIVLAPFAIASICLGKKSSFFVLLASLFNLTMSILFFTMENASKKAYASMPVYEGKAAIGWVAYVAGALLMIVALYLGYKAVMMMKDEVKHPSTPKGPSYNYLKK